MREQQESIRCTQSSPPPRLGRKYIRKLLEAFEPHQEAMFADLDRQIEESNPESLSRKSDDLSKQSQKTMKQLEQVGKTESGTDGASPLIALIDEMSALDEMQKTLRDQLRSTTRQNNMLRYKREYLVELLQTIHTMQQEGNWEKIGEREKYLSEFVLLGERFLTFEFTQQKLRLQTIEDIHEWMKQHRADFLPAMEEEEEQTSATKKTAKPPQRKCSIATKHPTPSVSPAQIYERQAWVRLLVSAQRYSSYFQDSLGELGVFVYDTVENKPRAILHLWANGTKHQFPVVQGTIGQQEVLTDTMRAWLAICWIVATGETGRIDNLRDVQRDEKREDSK